uniref:26S proteasome non-ATPase regulatory subunit 5 n=1 Tax=Trichuris muris TaxID=70415 RepID=A0A5S6QRR3_TRIMR
MTLEEGISFLRLPIVDIPSTARELRDILAELRAADEATAQGCLVSYVSALFSVWHHMDEELTSLSIKILREMFAKCGIEFVISRVSVNIIWGLKDGPSSLKEALLELVTTGFESNEAFVRELPLHEFNSLLTAIAFCLADESSSIGEKAQNLLVLIAKVPRSVSEIFENQPCVQLLHSMGTSKTSMRIRLYDLICSLVVVSEDIIELCKKEGFMTAMFNDIKSSDLLIQLNVIELLTELTSHSQFSMQFLHDNGVIPILHNLLEEARENPDGGLQHVALVKFFGCFFARYPKECVEEYADFLKLIYSYVRYYDTLPIGLRLLAFDTIALAASNPEGKRILANEGPAMKEAMECLGRAMRSGELEMRVRHLEAVEKIFTVENPSEINEFSELLLQWFNDMYDHRTPQHLYSLVKEPFQSHQLVMYKILSALAMYPWFPEKIKEVKGFFEYLVSRTWVSPETQHAKFELIQRLASNSEVKNVFTPAQQLKLTEYIRQGAMYFRAVPELATE